MVAEFPAREWTAGMARTLFKTLYHKFDVTILLLILFSLQIFHLSAAKQSRFNCGIGW